MNKKISITILIIVVIIAGYFVFREKQVVKLVDGTQCYMYSHKATEAEPFTITDYMDITINGNAIVGTRQVIQGGPGISDLYIGNMEGIVADNKITSVLSYSVEEQKNKEKEIFQITETGIEKLDYQFLEGKNIPILDTIKPFIPRMYTQTICEDTE